MGWIRVSLLPSDYENPVLRRMLDRLNEKADAMDKLTRPDISADLREAEEDWSNEI